MLNVYTGRQGSLEDALIEAVRASEAPERMVVVPRQLTLQTEQLLLDRLSLSGSFDLQVLSTERLCSRLFEATGLPEGERVDDRGRVMLARAAIRAAEARLTVYRGAERRRGFAESAAEQLERVRQARMTPGQLREWAERMGGTASLKLSDLAAILEEYEQLTQDRFLDGESEFHAAVERVGKAAFLHDTAIWFYGYDLVPPTLYELIASLSVYARQTGLFMPLENDPYAPDYDCFLPMEKAYHRLEAMVRACGGALRRVAVDEPSDSGRCPDLRLLERSLFAWPGACAGRTSENIILLEPRTAREECMYAAALSRELVRAQGWSWNDIQLMVSDPDAYAGPLSTAFADCGIPLVLSSSRSAARYPVVECLTTALRMLAKNCPQREMLSLLATGFLPITEDEAERYANFIVRAGLRGSMFLRPLRRGSEEERTALEPIRAKVAEPLVALKSGLRAAKTLPEQAAALFAFLEQLDAMDTLEKRIEALNALGERERASEVSQVWNRMLGAMDQMVALMGDEPLPLEELSATLVGSLSASVIKALPQSGDAVFAQGMNSACSRPVKALMILGLSDRPGAGAAGLLTQEQSRALSQISGRYLGPDDSDLSRMRRFHLKAAIGMASERVVLSCPMAAVDGASQRRSSVFDLVREIFTHQEILDGRAQAGADFLLRSAARPALKLVAQSLSANVLSEADRSALAALTRLSEADDGLRKALDGVRLALDRQVMAERMRPETARGLYRDLNHLSVTRLEQFAQCPFAYFLQSGIRPERVEPYEYRANDEGSFLHAAVKEFMLQSRQDLERLERHEAEQRMTDIAVRLLDELERVSALGDTSVTRAERRRLLSTARTCAAVLAEQMRGSAFRNTALERSFGAEDGEAAIRLADGTTLQGQIDRVDAWSRDDGDHALEYLRVIDYKRGGKALKLAEAYHGLSFQLPVYLASAMRRDHGDSAGVYYFPLTEGICETQSGDAAEVEKERSRLFRMEGLVPEDRALREALSPQLSDVLRVRVSEKTGDPVAGTLTASQRDYQGLIDHVLRQASRRSGEIRSGDCAIAPVRLDKRSACDWCAYRKVCLFDVSLDARQARKLPKMGDREALEAMSKAEDMDKSDDM